jgi:hypothetical protein
MGWLATDYILEIQPREGRQKWGAGMDMRMRGPFLSPLPGLPMEIECSLVPTADESV